MPFRLDTSTNSNASIEASLATKTPTSIPITSLSSSQLSVGQTFKGQLLSQLQDGSFTFNIGNTTVRLNLPETNNVGDTLSLRVVATDPRPSFIVEQDIPTTLVANTSSSNFATSNTEVSSTKSTNNLPTNNTPPLTLPTIVTSSSTTSISNATKLIDIILRQYGDTDNPNSISSKLPLLSNSLELTDTSKAANTFEKQIGQSGIFYESHVVDWSEGTKTKNDLASEPQFRLPELNDHFFETNDLNLLPNKEITQIIQQQLHTLENESVRWQGELFPGQKIEWEIRKEKQHQKSSNSGAENEAHWQSLVNFELPELGKISANLNINSNHLKITIQSKLQGTVDELKKYAPELASTMTSLGIIFEGLVIKFDDDPK